LRSGVTNDESNREEAFENLLGLKGRDFGGMAQTAQHETRSG
jgi:hypothetical protein